MPHPIISQLSAAKGQPGVSEKTKAKLEELIGKYGQHEELIDAEVNACQKWIEKAGKDVETHNASQAKAAEEQRLADEKAAEDQKQLEALKNTTFPHVTLIEQHKADITPEVSKKIAGFRMIVAKFHKNPTESNKKAAMKVSEGIVVAINDSVQKKKTLADEEVKKTEREKKEKEAAEAKENEEKAAKEKQEAEAKAEQERKQKEEQERYDREGETGNEFLKGIIGW